MQIRTRPFFLLTQTILFTWLRDWMKMPHCTKLVSSFFTCSRIATGIVLVRGQLVPVSFNLNLVFTRKTSNNLTDDICIVIFICSVVTLTYSLLTLPIRTNRRLSFLSSSCNECRLSITWNVITFSVFLYLHGRLICPYAFPLVLSPMMITSLSLIGAIAENCSALSFNKILDCAPLSISRVSFFPRTLKVTFHSLLLSLVPAHFCYPHILDSALVKHFSQLSSRSVFCIVNVLRMSVSTTSEITSSSTGRSNWCGTTSV